MSTPELSLPAVIERWRAVPTTIIADIDTGGRLLDTGIRPLPGSSSPVRLFGRAVTAQCESANIGPVLHAAAIVQAGDVLVIAAQGNTAFAMIGDIFSGYARSRGCVGLVCDGAVRDTGEIAHWDDFPVFCRSVRARAGAVGDGRAVNVPVTVGGCDVNPGDLVIGDDDGVVVLSVQQAIAMIDMAEARRRAERSARAELTSGKDIRQVFATSAGVV